MLETISNPALGDVTDAETDNLADAFNASYKAEKQAEEQDKTETPSPTPEPETVTETPTSEEKKPEPKATADPNEEQADDSKFVKARKSRDRLEKTWEAANARKAELDAQEARINAAKSAPQQQAKRPAWEQEEEIDLTPPKPKFKGNKIVHGDQEYGVKDLSAVINNSLTNGDVDGAKQVMALRDKLIERDTLYQYHQQDAEAGQQFQAEIQDTLRARPELQDMEQPLSKEVAAIAKVCAPAFKRIPGGFAMMVQAGEAIVKAQKVDAVSKENETLKARIKELEGRTAVGGSPPATRAIGGKKTVQDMDDDDLSSAFSDMVSTRFANR